MVRDNTQTSTSSTEFTIHNEDFPALPGSNTGLLLGGSNDSGNQSSASAVMSLGLGASGNMVNMGGTGSGVGIGGSIGSSGDAPPNKMKRGIQTNKDGRVTNIPANMVMDQFGMVGLLAFIRAAETDPNLVSLALGTDLTTLGLNLNSSE